MIPARYDLGSTIYTVYNRVSTIERDVTEDLTCKNINISDSAVFSFDPLPDALLFTDLLGNVSKKSLFSMFVNVPNQTTAISELNGNISIHLPQDISLNSSPEFQYVTVDNPPISQYHLANKKYVDDNAVFALWQDDVDEIYDPSFGLPISPTIGVRYISFATAMGWVIDNIYEWDGSTWVASVPQENYAVLVLGGSINPKSMGIYYPSTGWVYSKSGNSGGGVVVSHNDLANIMYSGNTGVHLNSLAQTFGGSKTFTNGIILPSTPALFTPTDDAISGNYVHELTGKIGNLTNMPHGFENTTTTNVSYNGSTRVLTIGPTGLVAYYWINGIRYSLSGLVAAPAHDATAGTDFYYYIDTTGAISVFTSYHFGMPDRIILAIVYYASSSRYILSEERHGCQMNTAIHMDLHENIGTYYISGLGISGYTIAPATPANSDNLYVIAPGIIADEDLFSDITGITPYYTVGRFDTSNAIFTWTPYVNAPYFFEFSYIMFNQYIGGAWTLQEAGNNRYVNYFVICIPSKNVSTQVIHIPGRTEYTNLTSAQGEDIYSFTELGEKLQEFLPRYRITYRTNSSYTTRGKCRIESVSTLTGTRVSIRQTSPIAHNSLPDLQLAGLGVTWGHINDQAQTIAGIKTLSDITDATSTSSGSVIVNGGVAIAKNIYSPNLYTTTNEAVPCVYLDDCVKLREVGGATLIHSYSSKTLGNWQPLRFSPYDSTTSYLSVNVDNITIPITTTSTSKTTGALIVSGGVGVDGNIYSTTLNATDLSVDNINVINQSLGWTSNISMDIAGFLELEAHGGTVRFPNNTSSTGIFSGAVVIAGGLGVNGAVNSISLGTQTIQSTSAINSTSTSTGAVIIAGGVGIGGNLYVGGNLNIPTISTNNPIYSYGGTLSQLSWGLFNQGIYVTQSSWDGTNYVLNILSSSGLVFSGLNRNTMSWNSGTLSGALPSGELRWICVANSGLFEALPVLPTNYYSLITKIILGRIWNSDGTFFLFTNYQTIAFDTFNVDSVMRTPTWNSAHRPCTSIGGVYNTKSVPLIVEGDIYRWPSLNSTDYPFHMFNVPNISSPWAWLCIANTSSYIYKTYNGGGIATEEIAYLTNLYDDKSGIPALMPNNRFVNHRIAIYASSNTIVILLGQTHYATAVDAGNAIGSEIHIFPQWFSDYYQACPIAYYTLAKGATWANGIVRKWNSYI